MVSMVLGNSRVLNINCECTFIRPFQFTNYHAESTIQHRYPILCRPNPQALPIQALYSVDLTGQALQILYDVVVFGYIWLVEGAWWLHV
jgi:hypothetical protein